MSKPVPAAFSASPEVSGRYPTTAPPCGAPPSKFVPEGASSKSELAYPTAFNQDDEPNPPPKSRS